MTNTLQTVYAVPELKPHGYFRILCKNADSLEDVCRDYFMVADVPNIAGLCAHLGTTPQKLRNLFQRAEDKPDDPDFPSDQALAILASTIMNVEDRIVSGGLNGNFNAHMSKFILSAFHNRHEKIVSENKTEKSVTIQLATEQPVSIEELRELDRLEKAMEEQSVIELTAMGKSTVRQQEVDEDMLTI